MEWSFLFFFNSALLGVGLAMDAFSVSMANGLHDPQMSRRRGVQIAGTFAIFQAVMPMTGWVCVHTIVELFSSFESSSPGSPSSCWATSAVKCSWRASRAKRPRKPLS